MGTDDANGDRSSLWDFEGVMAAPTELRKQHCSCHLDHNNTTLLRPLRIYQREVSKCVAVDLLKKKWIRAVASYPACVWSQSGSAHPCRFRFLGRSAPFLGFFGTPLVLFLIALVLTGGHQLLDADGGTLWRLGCGEALSFRLPPKKKVHILTKNF